MPSLFPVTAGRTSDILNHTRLVAQVASDQLALLQRQEQISTGRRINTPSEDSQAAVRAIGLQRLLEQKEQFGTNLLTSESFLGASENAISDISDLLISIRGTALSVASTTSSDAEREAAAITVRNAVTQLQDSVNKTFRGRYLFGGINSTSPPFEFDGSYIAYQGIEGDLQTYADINLLLDSNFSGHEVIGGISPQVEGRADINPILTPDTRLSDLRSGQGIRLGSIEISDGSNLSVVDLSSAETVADIARLIETNPPAGATVFARLVEGHFEIELVTGAGSPLIIQEVGSGTTAAELGIITGETPSTSLHVGADLDPRVTLTTRIDDSFGSRATGVSTSPNEYNNIVVRAKQHGEAFNGYRLQFVDDDLLQAAPGLAAGNETATLTTAPIQARAALSFSGTNNNLILTATTGGIDFNNVSVEIQSAGAIGNNATVNYNAASRRLTIGIDSSNNTEIQTVINQINAEGTFTAAYDASDPVDGGFAATATINSSDAGVISGNTGNSGAETNTLLVHIQEGFTRASSVLNVLQADSAITDIFDIELEAKDSPIEIHSGEGIIDVNATAITSNGSGQDFDAASGLRIINGGEEHIITFETAETVEDVLNILNGSRANVLAEINPQGDGINIRSRLSGTDFHIGENGGRTAAQLGVRSFDGSTLLADLNHGFGVGSQPGTDFVIRRHDNSELEIDITSAVTVNDVIDLIHNHTDNQDPNTRVTASFASIGNGLELVADDPTGATTLEVRAVSDAANNLGLVAANQRTATAVAAQAATAGLSFPAPNNSNTALTITAGQVGTDLDGYQIVFQNTQVGDVATASLDTAGRRLVVDIDASATTANTILSAINAEGTFNAALDLSSDPTNNGTGTPTATGTVGTTSGGTADVLTGRDTNPVEVKGAFNSLLRLNAAFEDFDLVQIQRAIGLLDEDFERLNFSRAELGVQQQQVDVFRGRLETEKIELNRTLSQEIDVDLAEAISGMLQQQASYQASLQLIGQTFRLTLLDFI